MLRELEIQFQEISIRALLSTMDKIFDLLNNPEDPSFSDPDFSRKEIVAEKRNEFERAADRLYNLCSVYLELKGVPLYIKKFDEKILPLYEERKQLSKLRSTDIYGVEKSAVTDLYRQFLFSFRSLGGKDEKHLTGIDFLENILEATGRIISEKGIKPSKEADVYNSVKVICEATFPEALMDGGFHPFHKKPKCYRPDIMIPLLNCAIEYKFATTVAELTTVIEQIHADVNGYSKHPTYKFFYAVFYVKVGITTKKNFKEMWADNHFPTNWKEIFVEGEVKLTSAKKTIKANKKK
jgi:hypothetical protein